MLSELTLIEEGRTRPSVEVVLRLRGVRQVHIFTHEKILWARKCGPGTPAGYARRIFAGYSSDEICFFF